MKFICEILDGNAVLQDMDSGEREMRNLSEVDESVLGYSSDGCHVYDKLVDLDKSTSAKLSAFFGRMIETRSGFISKIGASSDPLDLRKVPFRGFMRGMSASPSFCSLTFVVDDSNVDMFMRGISDTACSVVVDVSYVTSLDSCMRLAELASIHSYYWSMMLSDINAGRSAYVENMLNNEFRFYSSVEKYDDFWDAKFVTDSGVIKELDGVDVRTLLDSHELREWLLGIEDIYGETHFELDELNKLVGLSVLSKINQYFMLGGKSREVSDCVSRFVQRLNERI